MCPEGNYLPAPEKPVSTGPAEQTKIVRGLNE